MKTRELLKKYISEELFEDLSCFIEELYLMDVDYLILMARKFFNLFWVFHELNCEKYQEMGIPYYNDIRVVSDRALPVLQDQLKKGRCRIVIGDDIIIHGRGIRNLYNKIHDECPDIDVSIETFIINNDDTSVYEDIKDKIHYCYEGATDKWRDVSNRIVTTFLLSGRPYISYLPYFILDTTWESLFRKLNLKDCVSVSNYDFEYYGVELFVYFGNELEIAKELNCCSMVAMRFYNYKNIGRILAIPYFCTTVIDNDSLKRLTDLFRKSLFTENYNQKVYANGGAEEMRPMEFEYTMSLLLSIHLFNNTGIDVKKWPREIEYGTFSEYLITAREIEAIDADYYIQQVAKIDADIKNRPYVVPDNETELIEKYLLVQKKNRDIYRNCLSKRNWLKKSMTYSDCLAEYIERILLVNGNIDEERCYNKDYSEKSRLLGIPVPYILSNSADYWSSLVMDGEKDSHKKRVFAEIIQAIDSGKGSIVIRTFTNDANEEIRESLLHAGEQNYKYYELTNYPFMYGLMLIELYAKKKESYVNVQQMKEYYRELFDRSLDYLNVNYKREEQNELMQFSIIDEFGRLLIDVYKKYEDNDVLALSKKCAYGVIAEV